MDRYIRFEIGADRSIRLSNTKFFGRRVVSHAIAIGANILQHSSPRRTTEKIAGLLFVLASCLCSEITAMLGEVLMKFGAICELHARLSSWR